MKINNHLAPIDSYTVSPPSSSFLSFHNLFEVITLTMNRDIGESYQESINQSLFSRMVQLNNNYYAPLVKSIKSSSITSSIHQVGDDNDDDHDDDCNDGDDGDDYDSENENDCNVVVDDDYDYECNGVDDFDDDINMICYADYCYK